MRERIEQATRYVLTMGRQAVFQITVSLVATATVGYLTRDHGKTDAVAPTAAVVAAAPSIPFEPQPIAGLLRASFTPEGIRMRPAYPTEFGALFGPAPGKPYTELTSVEWSGSSERGVPKAEKPEQQPPAKALAAHQGCVAGCVRRTVLVEAVLPPARPASLTSAIVEAVPAPTAAAAPAREEGGVRLLGMRLPGFVPSGREVVKTVASLGDSVSGLFDGMR